MHPHGVLYEKDSEGADDVLVVTSAQMITADMVPDAAGIWLYHCHISDHMLAGMVARYEVKEH